jgi:dTDP-L-rhamnose 4-epimerase
MNKVLITGGAGFIGSNLVIKLLEIGYQVVVLDNLLKQIHGDTSESPLYLSIKGKVEFIKGSITNEDDWIQALKNVDIVVHLAALTGTGQSMYEINQYIETNILGTSKLLHLITEGRTSVKKIILASSRAIYGEGKYECIDHGSVYPVERKDKDMLDWDFEPKCPFCSKELRVLATDEESEIRPTSIYGITKQVQEQMISICGQSLNIPTIALRFQNVYGPGQSLSNPYTGILSIFSTQIFNKNNINIFEDGKESRDFIYIDDAVNSIVCALNIEDEKQHCFNVGSGEGVSVLEVAKSLINLYKSNVHIDISGDYRLGDIRHNYADLNKSIALLKFNPKISFSEGLSRFSKWVISQEVSNDNYQKSIDEMNAFGLYKKNKVRK